MSEQQFSPEFSFKQSRLEVEPHRRLVSLATRSAFDIVEYADKSAGKRILTLPSASEQAHLHSLLQEKRVPVFKKIAVHEQNLLLDVPADARTVRDSLKFIARDVLGYKEIFSQIGIVLGRCAVSGFGLPDKGDHRSVLEGIAFTLNNTESFGGNVQFVPPYSFSTELNKSDELEIIRNELIASNYISGGAADELIRATSLGWENVRS